MSEEFILPYEIKKRLFDEILKLDNPFNLNKDFTLPDFLSKILPLRDMPSEDSRYNNAYDDAYQHLVRNNDWSFEETFERRFKIIENNEGFKKFLEVILNNSEDGNIEAKKLLFNKYLNEYQYRINQKYDESSKLEYFIIRIEDNYIPNDFSENAIPFFVIGKYDTNFIPKHYPCVILREKDWNDWFKYRTSFHICYVGHQSNLNFIGDIKILNINNPITFDVIDKEFYKLDSNYCSLIQDEITYFSLKHILGDKLYSFLSALNDVACFPSICEKFEKEEGFRASLCRATNKTEEIIRTIRHKLNYGKDIKDFFNFEFLFKPLYSESIVSFKFKFDIKKTIPQRLYCLIGKNGVGKTSFLKDLTQKLSKKDFENVLPIPLFGKIMVVSYSNLDSFEKLKSKADFNFTFCGLINPNTNTPLTDKELLDKIHNSIVKIEDRNSVKDYADVCEQFIEEDIFNQLFKRKSSEDYELNKNNIPIISRMSSGQKSLFYIITEIVANIRYSSFILFDEPETHLHPNAITEFMNAIMGLLQEFNSFGLVATHSPLIVREIFSENIFVLDKDETTLRVRKLEFETFGENLTTITNEIFGNRDVPKYYQKRIEELVESGKTYKEIESELQGEVPLNLNIKILIKSLIQNRDEKS
jgi:hypothetical protein